MHLRRPVAPARVVRGEVRARLFALPLSAGPRGGRRSLSPLLANVHLHPVDLAMRGHVGYQRCADDLVCLAASRAAAERAWRRMDRAARVGGQVASPSKSGVRPAGPRWRYLGWEVSPDGRLGPPDRERKEESLDAIRRRYRRLRSHGRAGTGGMGSRR